VLFLATAFVFTQPLWTKPRPANRWPWILAFLVLSASVTVLSWTRLPALEDRLKTLLTIEGVEGNDRWALWQGTCRLWARSPVFGTGLGSYRYAIGIDKPATGTAVVEQAHNDWLEWATSAGWSGVLILLVALAGVAKPLWPPRTRRLRFEYRYPLAAAVFALSATGLHELVGFGLQTPLNRYLFAAWIGLVWGIAATVANEPRVRTVTSATREGGAIRGAGSH
jgi:O-antigen ligase